MRITKQEVRQTIQALSMALGALEQAGNSSVTVSAVHERIEALNKLMAANGKDDGKEDDVAPGVEQLADANADMLVSFAEGAALAGIMITDLKMERAPMGQPEMVIRGRGQQVTVKDFTAGAVEAHLTVVGDVPVSDAKASVLMSSEVRMTGQQDHIQGMANSWRKVTEVLDELVPGWADCTGSGTETAACRTIRELKTQRDDARAACTIQMGMNAHNHVNAKQAQDEVFKVLDELVEDWSVGWAPGTSKMKAAALAIRRVVETSKYNAEHNTRMSAAAERFDRELNAARVEAQRAQRHEHRAVSDMESLRRSAVLARQQHDKLLMTRGKDYPVLVEVLQQVEAELVTSVQQVVELQFAIAEHERCAENLKRWVSISIPPGGKQPPPEYFFNPANVRTVDIANVSTTDVRRQMRETNVLHEATLRILALQKELEKTDTKEVRDYKQLHQNWLDKCRLLDNLQTDASAARNRIAALQARLSATQYADAMRKAQVDALVANWQEALADTGRDPNAIRSIIDGTLQRAALSVKVPELASVKKELDSFQQATQDFGLAKDFDKKREVPAAGWDVPHAAGADVGGGMKYKGVVADQPFPATASDVPVPATGTALDITDIVSERAMKAHQYWQGQHFLPDDKV